MTCSDAIAVARSVRTPVTFTGSEKDPISLAVLVANHEANRESSLRNIHADGCPRGGRVPRSVDGCLIKRRGAYKEASIVAFSIAN